MKKRILAAAVTLSILLSGCTGSDMEALMRPPTLNHEQQMIKEALIQDTGRDIVMKFPKSGKNRSAFIEYPAYTSSGDIGASGRLVFYTTTVEGAGVHMNYLLPDGKGGWQSVADIEGRPGEINSVEFSDMDGDGRREIVTTWTLSTTQQREVAVYSLAEDGTLSLAYQKDYTEICLVDLDGNMLDELLVISFDPVNKQARAQLIQFQQGEEAKAIGQVEMDGAITAYAAVKEGRLRQGKKAVYVDAYKDATSLATEILCWENGFLSNLTYSPNHPNVTQRQTTLAATDINQDGITEIPQSYELPGYGKAPYSEKLWLTYWYRYDEISGKPVMGCVMNIVDGYYFEFPDSWVGNMTAQSDRNSRTMQFGIYEYRDGEYGSFERPVLSIRVMPLKLWKEENTKGWVLLEQKDHMIYCYKIEGVTSGEFSESFAGGVPADEFISERFKLIQ